MVTGEEVTEETTLSPEEFSKSQHRSRAHFTLTPGSSRSTATDPVAKRRAGDKSGHSETLESSRSTVSDLSGDKYDHSETQESSETVDPSGDKYGYTETPESSRSTPVDPNSKYINTEPQQSSKCTTADPSGDEYNHSEMLESSRSTPTDPTREQDTRTETGPRPVDV